MSSALLTDRYELTMLAAALADGSAQRRCVFEVFTRRLPDGRRFGVVAGTQRVLQAITDFTFDAAMIAGLQESSVIDPRTAEFLSQYRFSGDVDGYPEGELYFPYSPLLTVSGTFAEAVVLETVVLSILNHDSAIAAAAARMVSAAQGRPVIEMGSRRAHEIAAVASARAAYLGGFASTSNLAAGAEFGVPTAGTAAHAFTLLHDDELAAFRSQVAALGPGTTLLVDTYDITQGITNAVAAAGTALGAVRIDSGDLGPIARQARAQLDELGNTDTRIVVSGDLDEFAIASLAALPVDAYGAGTAVVTGSGAPTAGLVYKLVSVDGRPVAKRSEHKASQGGRKTAYRSYKPTGTAVEEIVVAASSGVDPSPAAETSELQVRPLQVPLMRTGQVVDGLATLDESRAHLLSAMVTLPWDGLKLSRGEPAIATRVEVR
ncbi:nicotinate phosphoribosyltransferase [Jatrophihabitans sp. GAS493]|uniref:nicotinate phosphoribosyltransferase n=1 Tax=Jatrophihabitans sp. GAS493 TaxID=1907575 RepID=UPI000BB8AE3C|nr:nicotinate phosphoribosyltransferase [Jatrophihabitans sp. GAS493]SOD72635.1 nicotinate phosphoribosyltransferase [Jatrophihabitans sp. GAS493]